VRQPAHSRWIHFLLRHPRTVGSLLVAALVLAPLVAALLPQVANAGINTWTPVTVPNNMNSTAMAMSSAFPCDKTVFVGTDGFGVYKTTQGDNDDAIWYPVNAGMTDLSITSLAVSPNYNRCDRAAQFGQGDTTIIAGTRTGRVYVSTNGGASWSEANGGLPDLGTYAVGGGGHLAQLRLRPHHAGGVAGGDRRGRQRRVPFH